MRNIERGLYRSAPGIGKAPVKRDMKNILKSEMKRLDGRQIGKAIERLGGHGFSSEQIHQNFVYRSFIKNASRSPDEETGFFDKLDLDRWFHGKGGLLQVAPFSAN